MAVHILFDMSLPPYNYERNHHLYCLDDYTDHWFIGEEGTEVKIAGVYGHYVYVICGAQVGWVNEEDIDY